MSKLTTCSTLLKPIWKQRFSGLYDIPTRKFRYSKQSRAKPSEAVVHESLREPIAVVLNPPSTYSTSPVMPEAKSEHKAAAFPTSSIVTFLLRGFALHCQHFPETFYTRCGQGLDRTARDGVNASSFRT